MENLVSANEKYAEAIGRDYGPLSSTVQAQLLVGFTHSLKVACGIGLDTQIAYIVDELTPEAKEILTTFARMI